MKIRISEQSGLIEAIGQLQDGVECPQWIELHNYTQWKYLGAGDTMDVANWQLLPADPEVLKIRDIEFGQSLLLEFLTGQKDIALDNATYRAVSDTFKYAEAALRRGDIPQAKTELTNISLSPPVWTQEAKDYFISRINSYLGI